ncbi:MAG TPA: hypothetical protein VNH82_03450 [Candidatus Dormibacteraeota bacterium]|nr:hypothetical protein [Candidatus Dormibacteraeota bacterium]
MTGERREVVVLARGALDREESAFAVRVALALPLGGLTVRLVLVDSASALALATPPQLGAWTGGLTTELETLIREEEVPVVAELESLVALGLADRDLRPGVEVATRTEVITICGSAATCLVL